VKSHKTQHQAALAGEDEIDEDIGVVDGLEDDGVEMPVVFPPVGRSDAPITHAASSDSAAASALPNAALLWPPPPAPAAAASVSNEALQDLLAAWYWSGFYAGRLSMQPK
jgi:hypothetical protein